MTTLTPSFRPVQCSPEIDAVIRKVALRYNMPRWFLYVICQRESSFNVNATDGKGLGLTQLTGAHHNGMPFPENLSTPDNNFQQWRWDMAIGRFGEWIKMTQVTRLTDPKDPEQNLDRFATVHAVPAYHLCAPRYRLTSPGAIWRRVAFHWKAGIHVDFWAEHEYFTAKYGYNKWEADFRGPCEAEDGVYLGPPTLPLSVPAPVSELERLRMEVQSLQTLLNTSNADLHAALTSLKHNEEELRQTALINESLNKENLALLGKLNRIKSIVLE